MIKNSLEMEKRMEKIVLFTGGIETQEYFSKRIGEFFQKQGYEVFFFDLLREKESFISLVWFCEKGNTVLITFNFQGIAGEKCFQTENKGNFWDERDVFCINLVVDHPFYYHDYLLKIPRRYHQISIDRFHKKYLERFYPNVKNSSFLALGGTELKIRKDIFADDRVNEIIFTGNYTPPHTFDKYFTCNGEEYGKFYQGMTEDLIAHPEKTMEEVMEAHICEEMGRLDDTILRVCMKNMIFIDLYVRFYFRGEVIKALADSGLQVHTFGKGWDLLKCEHPENLLMAGNVDSFTCLKEIGRAQVSINVMPWFKDGAHDRIFNSMLNGALCLSDDSIYLREEMKEDEMAFYSLKEIKRVPELVREYLTDVQKRRKIAEKGYEKAKREHSWECRAGEILRIIKEESNQ